MSRCSPSGRWPDRRAARAGRVVGRHGSGARRARGPPGAGRLGRHRVRTGPRPAGTRSGAAQVGPTCRYRSSTVPTLRRLLRFVALVVLGGVLTSLTVVAVAPQLHDALGAARTVPEKIDLNALDDYAVRSEVYASDGSLLTTLHAEQNRQPVSLSQVPQPVIDAVLAVEDADFYLHKGVNARAVVRALTQNVSAGEIQQGGSTITQQLVKNALAHVEPRPRPQEQGGRAGLPARAGAHQGPDPREVPQHRSTSAPGPTGSRPRPRPTGASTCPSSATPRRPCSPRSSPTR